MEVAGRTCQAERKAYRREEVAAGMKMVEAAK